MPRLGAQSRSAANFERSRAALAIARATYPSAPLSYHVQAEVELAAGRPEAPLGQALVAYSIEPRNDRLFLARQSALAAPPGETPLLMVTEAPRRRETAPLQVFAAELSLKLGVAIPRARPVRSSWSPGMPTPGGSSIRSADSMT